MSPPEPKAGRWTALDQDTADQEANRQAEEDAAAAILSMLTSGRVEPDVVRDADGTPLSTSSFERRAMWF